MIYELQGVPQYWAHFAFCCFVSFYSTKIQKLGEFYNIQEICYMIGTRILKIDSELAEIFEVKDGTRNLEIENDFGVTSGNFDLIYRRYF